MKTVDLTDVNEVMRQPRAEEIPGSQRSEFRMLVSYLPVNGRKGSQPLDRSGALTAKTMQRCLQVARIETTVDNRSLGINVRPLPIRMFQQRPQPKTKIVRFFFCKMVDDFDDRPLIGRRLP